MEIAIIGAGIGGLTLALQLHDAGIRCRIYESVEEVAPIGVGINVLPHATAVLAKLGLQSQLAAVGITTEESAFFNRFGQLIHSEPAGRFAGYEYPQFSIHRGDLQFVLLEAVRERLGADAIAFGHKCLGFEEDEGGVILNFATERGEGRVTVHSDALVACDGIHSAIRKQFYPEEGEPRYSGINMWRGVTRAKPFLTGRSMVRAGWLNPGKMVIYPIRDNIDDQGNQLINWVAELETPHHVSRDWNRRGKLEDFIGVFEDWKFDWLDVPTLIESADSVLEFPMVDQDPLPRWSFGRATLMGDAAHPMVPRGSNGAGQAILDTVALRAALLAHADPAAAFAEYEAERRPATSEVVRMNRVAPPDILLKEVVDRTGDKPFKAIGDILTPEEIEEISERYKRVAGLKKG